MWYVLNPVGPHVFSAELTAIDVAPNALTLHRRSVHETNRDVQRGDANVCRVCVDWVLDVRDRVVHPGLDCVDDLRLLCGGTCCACMHFFPPFFLSCFRGRGNTKRKGRESDGEGKEGEEEIIHSCRFFAFRLVFSLLR